MIKKNTITAQNSIRKNEHYSEDPILKDQTGQYYTLTKKIDFASFNTKYNLHSR